MGFDAFKDEEETEESSESQSTYVSFKNPGHPEVDVPEEKAHRHSQEYFDAVQEMRDELGQDINTVFGEFAAGSVEADEGEPERLQQLFENLTADE
jgi:hypothetical protein